MPAVFKTLLHRTLTAVVTVTLITQPLSAQICKPYVQSGPIVVTRDNQVIAYKEIQAGTGTGIDVNGHKGVMITNVIIRHSRGAGIKLNGADDTTITNADIVHEGGPLRGANRSANENNIDCLNSANLLVDNVRLTGGSSGIYMETCNGSRLHLIEGHDQRGPFPRGQLVQWNASANGRLANFSNETSLTNSWPEDNVNVYHSTTMRILSGLLDGNNAPSGDGVMVDEQSGDVVVENVDAVHQGNSCFGVWGGGGHDVTFTNTRCRDTHCNSVRGVPSSNGLGWTIDPVTGRNNIQIARAKYFNLCNPGNIVWDETMLSVSEFKQENFTARKPLRVELCKYGY